MSKDTYKVFCLSEAVSPITHMSGTAGNEAVVMREGVMTDDGVRYVPVLSGNALRHRMVRDPGASHLVDAMGLRGRLTLQSLNFLFHGGNLTEKGGRENLRTVADLHRVFPLLKLIGCSLPGQIVGGVLSVHRGTLACAENQPRIARMLPDGFTMPEGRLRPATAFIEPYQYTRSDVRSSKPGLATDGEEDGDSNLMIFAGQAVIPGAVFVHGFTAREISLLEIGALLFAIQAWQSAGATIGGQASRGHGRLDTSWCIAPAIDVDAAISLYTDHVSTVASEAAAMLESLLGPREEGAKPKRKAKAGT